MTNATEITFGVEIETHIPAGRIPVGGHGNGMPIAELPGWKADRDPSIRCRGGREACEFVSPIMKGAEGFGQLLAAICTIKAMGAQVNASCGVHIHIGFDRANMPALEKLTTLVANFEKAIFAASGTKNRERGRWCHGLQRYGTFTAARVRSQCDRYHVLNMGSEHPTVEFRAFSASLNPQKLVGWVRMAIGLAERALCAKRVTNWTAKPVSPTSPIHRKGEGQTALTRLFYQLGWIKGRTNHVYGNVIGEGLPTLDQTKRQLKREARKYDAQA